MTSSWEPSYNLPEPTTISLPGRGTTTLWDSGLWDSGPGTQDAEHVLRPPVLLLHGWNIDAPTNYGFTFPQLTKAQRVLMYDQQGHGQGPRHDGLFTLEDAANDAVAILDALEIGAAIVVGYSLGGAVAQTLAHNHPERCAGLVLSATSGRFAETKREVAEFAVLAQTARLLKRVPPTIRAGLFAAILSVTTQKYPDWIAAVVRKGDPITLLEAGASLGKFDSSDWTDVEAFPSSFIVTTKDVIVPKKRQVALATRLDVGSLHSIAAGHEVPILDDAAFSAALAQAIQEVTSQALAAH